MEKIALVKEVRRRSADLGLALSVLFHITKINRTTFNAWTSGFFSPSPESVCKLEEYLAILDDLEELREKRSKK